MPTRDEITREVIKGWAKRMVRQIESQEDLTIDEAIENALRAMKQEVASREDILNTVT